MSQFSYFTTAGKMANVTACFKMVLSRKAREVWVRMWAQPKGGKVFS